eukprot:TRINITY_DN8323_c0_g1_i1.p1 TRINITY_DN8323_c0_g1~~TRINITY_DN8323_c0_g1_i1.p1  ORF type:complete len:170 (+),score=19.14 TRINITY_DN8323_c0_g1_i1:196-705(+)
MGIADKIKPAFLSAAPFAVGDLVETTKKVGRTPAGHRGRVFDIRRSELGVGAGKEFSLVCEGLSTRYVFANRFKRVEPVINLAKPLQSRCGYPAEVVHRFKDGDGAACLLVMFKKPQGLQAHTLYADGRYLKEGRSHGLDLQNVKEQVFEIGRAVQQECRDRSRMPSSA